MDGGSRGGGGGLAAAATTNAGLNPNTPPPFLSKTYDMVDDPATDAVISWGPHNNSFLVWDQSEFARDLLPKYFKHSNFSSFVRQLNTYGIRDGSAKDVDPKKSNGDGDHVDESVKQRVELTTVERQELQMKKANLVNMLDEGFRKVDHDRFEFANEGFLKGQKHLLKNIIRRKLSHPHSQAQEPQTQNAPVAICIEVGNFGIEEEIERLKRDKNILMQELIRLRQQQQTADHQLQTLGKRLQGMERQQQLMMSFLAKAMQSPGLFAQLVQQNENNRHVAGVKKKRRLPRQESSSLEEKCASPDGQIIKYQPLMNDSTTAMLAQMLSFDPSSRLEEPLNNSDGLLVDNFPSPPEALKGSSSLDQNCAVTHAEVPQNPDVPPFFPVSSSFSTACSSSTASNEIQSEAGIADITMAGVLQDTSMLSPAPVAISCEFPEMQGMVPDESVGDVPIENFVVPKGESMYLNEIATGVDGSMPTEETVDDQKLSEIMHSLLEEFIAASPQTGETQEMVKSTEEAVEMQQPASGSKWENARNMDNLTGQMASDSKV